MEINFKDTDLPISNLVRSQEMPFIATLDKEAAGLSKQNKNIIKLSGGAPSHYPKELFSIIEELGSNYDCTILNYSPIDGYENLRSLLATLVSDRYHEKYTNKNVLVCSGGCSGLFLVLKTLLNSNEKVLIPSPCWEYLPRIVENCGGASVRIDISQDINWEDFIKEIDQRIKNGIKIVCMNSPLNPTGKVIPISVKNEIIKLCQRNKVWYVSDDVTIDFCYNNEDNCYINNSDYFISINSFSKNLGITGFRFGFILANIKIIEQVKKSQLYTCMYPNSLIQKIVEKYLSKHLLSYYDYIKKVNLSYSSKAKTYFNILSKNKNLILNPIEGGLFFFPKIQDGYYLDYKKLLNEYFITVAPGQAFGLNMENHFRMFIGVDEKDFLKASRALEKVIYKNAV
ncbi:pyridoxal phosphate-dependent aminotransferase [Allofrancisella guangzhouensis]|uniref:Aminotransferase class I/classII large domain-containing protein n=1 Tax=Allofrancisella guangzhouensis TaxID=594679 RepID=A0A0A8E459_9GAMM|nr:pyridoxal phosphate-dependent aminotransferase [Allofrancisella guangzhouensis]AJC48734.1 hypothetical protein SD28_03290 [Allofrancisella guangzhouensis]MBK2027387.1 pyridoxal phosphate-dependent aminotransferase [Allofrancisella guangzhouensis]MBK2043428.1 pyridoxal phosphate-dependent aminotransferase [Allofrancisella guangzhouensis]MBK2045197.1 pyridoxal phosphate-dependent aminotransferase [Allofrancisella guangzhouensis]